MVWDYSCNLDKSTGIVNESSYHMKNFVPIPTWKIINTLIEVARTYPAATATQAIGQAIAEIRKLSNEELKTMEAKKQIT